MPKPQSVYVCVHFGERRGGGKRLKYFQFKFLKPAPAEQVKSSETFLYPVTIHVSQS